MNDDEHTDLFVAPTKTPFTGSLASSELCPFQGLRVPGRQLKVLNWTNSMNFSDQ